MLIFYQIASYIVFAAMALVVGRILWSGIEEHIFKRPDPEGRTGLRRVFHTVVDFYWNMFILVLLGAVEAFLIIQIEALQGG